MKKKISLVIPVYHNASSLSALHKRLSHLEGGLNEISVDLELIFVDDGSADNSYDELLKINEKRPGTKIIKLARNFGSVQASKCGLIYATGDCCSIIAADLQDPPELILEMYQKWSQGNKFIACVRSTRDDSFLQKLFAQVFYFIVRKFVISNYPKNGFDLFLIDKTVLPYIVNSSKSFYTPIHLFWLGFRPILIPYHRNKRHSGVSMWSFAKRFKVLLDVVLGYSVFPVRIISLIGIIVSVMSFGYGVAVIISVIQGNVEVRGFAALATLISFLVGIAILMIGILGEYIWRIFDECNKRPAFVIDTVVD